MPQSRIFMEIWTSNKRQQEKHFFLAKGDSTYVFGINPQLVDKKTERKIIKLITNLPKVKKIRRHE